MSVEENEPEVTRQRSREEAKEMGRIVRFIRNEILFFSVFLSTASISGSLLVLRGSIESGTMICFLRPLFSSTYLNQG